MVLRHRKASASTSKGPGKSTDASRAQVLRGSPKALEASMDLSFSKEQVWTFLRAVGDHQVCKIGSVEHEYMAFELVIQVQERLII